MLLRKRYLNSLNINKLVNNNKNFILRNFSITTFDENNHPFNSSTQQFILLKKYNIELFCIGTAHISESSAIQVKNVCNTIKPDVICIELCNERAKRIMNINQQQIEQNKDLTANKILQPIQSLINPLLGSSSSSSSSSNPIQKIIQFIYAYLRLS